MPRPRIDFYEKEAEQAKNSKNLQIRTDALVVLELIKFIKELEAEQGNILEAMKRDYPKAYEFSVKRVEAFRKAGV